MSVESVWLSRLPLFAGVALLVFLTYLVLSPFLVPVAWASIIVFVSWPAYQRLLNLLGGHANLAATLMTLCMTLLLVGPLAWVILLLQSELQNIASHLGELAALPNAPLPPWLKTHAGWLAQEIDNAWTHAHSHPETLRDPLSSLLNMALSNLGPLAEGIGKNIGRLVCTIFSLFFFYRDGRTLLRQMRRTLAQILHRQDDRYLQAAGNMARAVVFGIVLTALAQALLAGMSYAVAEAPNPVFLALVTFLAALIPFGTPFAYGGVALWLFVNGDAMSGIGVALWGALVVSSVDNIIRPLVISSATQISFLLVMFGVLGGLASFGMIGLFLGPIILAVTMAIWQEWLQQPLEAPQES